MEAIDREDIDPKTIDFNTISNAVCKNITKEDILTHIQTVITGCCILMQLPNYIVKLEDYGT